MSRYIFHGFLEFLGLASGISALLRAPHGGLRPVRSWRCSHYVPAALNGLAGDFSQLVGTRIGPGTRQALRLRIECGGVGPSSLLYYGSTWS